MNKPVLLGAAIFLAAVFGAQAETPATRAWKDVTGRVIQAEFVTADEHTVTVRMAGKDYPIPLDKLSSDDREWIRNKLAPPPSTAAAPATTSGLSIAGVTVKPGVKTEFETPVPAAVGAKARKITGGNDSYDDVDMTKAQVGLLVPKDFDPARSWPVIIVSVTDSGRAQGKNPSSVKAMGTFADAANELGWVVIGADCPGNLTPGLPANRAALAEAALEALAAQWPASKDWPVATGGFSGGAKYSGWLGGWFSKAGRRVPGMFMGGCNEDMASKAIDEWKAPKREFTKARIFVSTGKADRIAGPGKTEAVVKSLKRSGFEVREELHDGGHEVNKDHVRAAMEWFAEGVRGTAGKE